MIGNTILFINAGFQTTAETMLYVFYELAMHPDIQQKVGVSSMVTFVSVIIPQNFNLL